MFQLSVSRSQLVISRDTPLPRVGVNRRFHAVVDELLALDAMPMPRHGSWQGAQNLHDRPSVEPTRNQIRLYAMYSTYVMTGLWDSPEAVAADARGWVKNGIPSLFEKAARKASAGQLSKELAPFLERIQFAQDGNDRAPDFLSIAAWTLLEGLHRRSFVIAKCDLCGMPWLAASEDAHYCHRLAEGSFNLTCLDAGSLKDHRARKRAKTKGD